MAVIHIRDIDDALFHRLKVRSAEERLTLKDAVVKAVEGWVSGKENHAPKAEVEQPGQDAPQGVVASAKADDRRTVGKQPRQTKTEAAVQQAYEKAGVRPHDTANCRIYGCLLCKAAKA